MDRETIEFTTGIRHALQSAHQALTDAQGGTVSAEARQLVHLAIGHLESAKRLVKIPPSLVQGK